MAKKTTKTSAANTVRNIRRNSRKRYSGEEKIRIVRISVNVPQDVYSEMEEELIAAYDLRDAIVIDCESENEQIIQRDVGAAAAY
jgi:DNA-binding transcriptional regulator LsrR (DeoR family)